VCQCARKANQTGLQIQGLTPRILCAQTIRGSRGELARSAAPRMRPKRESVVVLPPRGTSTPSQQIWRRGRWCRCKVLSALPLRLKTSEPKRSKKLAWRSIWRRGQEDNLLGTRHVFVDHCELSGFGLLGELAWLGGPGPGGRGGCVWGYAHLMRACHFPRE
jgi:hypothetical protein